MIHEGQDPELKAIRNHLPEPSRYEQQVIYALQRPPVRLDWNITATDYIKETEVFKVMFEKQLIIIHGIKFWAWVCTKDGCYYL